MMISPLGIFGANHDLARVAEWARQDAAITHPHPVCRQANALFTMAIAQAVRTECDARELYRRIAGWAEDMKVDGSLLGAIQGAAIAAPADYVHQQGWVLTAFRNVLWQLSHAQNLEEAVVNTVMRGGDTDTNAAICGALLGAVYGRGRDSRPMDRMLAQLPPCGRTTACQPSSPRVLLAGGCAGVGRVLDFLRRTGRVGAQVRGRRSLQNRSFVEAAPTGPQFPPFPLEQPSLRSAQGAL